MIISSLLDTDLYKFTMMQVVLHHFPGAQVEYRFKCRNEGVDLRPYVGAIQEEIQSLCSLRFRQRELDYLRGFRFIKSDFVDFLGLFQMNPKYISVAPSAKDNGEIDIVIGTHRLTSKDIQFKDLGLVVIDEEQRFGVAQKEKLKHLRNTVDVLTMSATPIPRTLNLALLGARDMSVINTAPNDRLPVHTCIEHFDEQLIREAIERELAREGQVFFLHLSLIHISEPTRLLSISYAVFCLKKKTKKLHYLSQLPNKPDLTLITATYPALVHLTTYA